jgi:hypothetical protein
VICLLRVFWICALIPALAIAADKGKSAQEAAALPYLGPGASKLSAAEYERIYKNYIQTSILLGYSLSQGAAPACEQALSTIFRQVGMFGYPVPADAQHIQRSSKKMSGFLVETYEMGGVIVQLARDPATNAPARLVLVNSASTKATRRLSQSVKQELLELKRDPITGLERVQKIPVGYNHPLLSPAGQGIYVKDLRFNRKADSCEPVEFHDNTWVGGFELSQERCSTLQADVDKVWKEQISPADFTQRELARMKAAALKNAVANGSSEAEAKAIIERQFVRPLTNEINVVGSAMRNLAQCNLLALGRGGAKPSGNPNAGAGESGEGTGATPAGGSAR